MKDSLAYFYEISKIPRESGNEKCIATFLCKFAKKFNLEYEVDNYYNVIIKKNFNQKESIILQAHLDMVCVKDIDIDFNFKNQGINIIKDDKFLKANKTTLGADDGIGVATILSILSDTNLKSNYNIEALFTTNEETSMLGAQTININTLKSKMMIGLDHDSIEDILIGCAGVDSYTVKKIFNISKSNLQSSYSLNLSGFIGGHSGDDINKGRLNSINFIFDFFESLNCEFDLINIYNENGKVNAIANNITVNFYADIEENELSNKITTFIKHKNKIKENISFKLEKIYGQNSIGIDNTKLLLKLFNVLKSGVLKIDNNGNILTSLNVGIIKLDNGNLEILFSTRNHSETENNFLKNYLISKVNKLNFKISHDTSNPCFKAKENSRLQNIVCKAYENLFNKTCITKISEGTVETSIFSKRINNLDSVVIGANIYDLHSIHERVEIDSIYKLEQLVKQILLI